MPPYSFECVDESGSTVWQREIDCGNDLQAIDTARRSIDCKHQIEIWSGDRHVAQVTKGKGEWAPAFTRFNGG